MKTYESEYEGYPYVTTTAGANGYPTQLMEAVLIEDTDCETWQDAVAFAERNGLTLMIVSKKNGWGLWYRENRANDMLHADRHYSDSILYCKSDKYLLEEERDERIKAIEEEWGDKSQLDEEELDQMQEEIDAAAEDYDWLSDFDDLADDECIIVDGERHDVRKKMAWSYFDGDVTTHAIAAVKFWN